ncbi:MAG: hypothetical protein LEGION0398_MBIBDBAK_00465 [Legionellaceae bacterium]
MHELTLKANFEVWRDYSVRKSKVDFLRFSETIFERDNYTCQFCGFQSKHYQEIIDLNDNYKKFDIASSVTTCCFCAQCFFLESVGIGNFGGGTLIYLPEISQANLNSFCHILFSAIAKNNDHKANAELIYRNLRFRTQQVEEQFGEGTSDPSAFGQLLIETNFYSVDMAFKKAIHENIRLLPSSARFKVQIEKWLETAFSDSAIDEN